MDRFGKLIKEIGSLLILLALFCIFHFGINSPQTHFFMNIIEKVNDVFGYIINFIFGIE